MGQVMKRQKEKEHRTELSSHRGFLLCGHVLCFVLFLVTMQEKGEIGRLCGRTGKCPWDVLVSWPLSVTLIFHNLGNDVPARWDGCRSLHGLLFLVLFVILGVYIHTWETLFLSDTSLDFLFQRQWRGSLSASPGSSGLSLLCCFVLASFKGFPSGSAVKNPPSMQGNRRLGFNPCVGKTPWRWSW